MTKERKKVERDNKEKVARKNAAQQAKRNFFGTLIADNIGDTNNAHTDPENNDAIAIEENDDDNVVVIENPLVTVTDSMDVIEKLDFDLDFDDEEASRNNSDDCRLQPPQLILLPSSWLPYLSSSLLPQSILPFLHLLFT